MKFNNKWDMLPDKEVNNRQRKGRSRFYRQDRDSDQSGIFGEMTCVERQRQAQGKSESEGGKGMKKKTVN